MGVYDFVAKDPEDYIEIATKHATSSSSNKVEIRQLIMTRAGKNLFRQEEGPKGWADIFFDIATRPRTLRWRDEIVLDIEKQVIQ